MQQLALEVRLADYALFETFLAGPNEPCVHALRDAARSAGTTFVWVWGAAGSGRSHLLQACVNEAGAAGTRAAYLPLGASNTLVPEVMDGLEACQLVVVDDVNRVAGNAAWERGLLMLYEGVRQRTGRLVLAADQAPAHCEFRLPDLKSRFASAATFRLRSMSEEERIRAMQLRARWRGLDLSDDVANYLLARVARDTGSLFELLDRLDREALVARRRLTVPFVRDVLGRDRVG